ncbi:MAG: peptidylprolyl isomerase [Fimbriimonadaceae bacterium]|nr:peptidylprolyl isomerase [Fimbriimonadaceae bacterium]
MKVPFWIPTLAVAAFSLAWGCAPSEPAPTEPAPTPEAETEAAVTPKPEPAAEVSATVQPGEEVAVIDTDKGKIVVRFRPDKAPKHVENFKDLVGRKFYDGTRFHRCILGFMIQGGDPNSKEMSRAAEWGTGGFMEGGRERMVALEPSDLSHKRGVLSMARSNDPNSASSQFFIMQADNEGLNGQYSAFGETVAGMTVIDQIVKTGDVNNNGSVEPANAVVVKSIRMDKWPVDGVKADGPAAPKEEAQ